MKHVNLGARLREARLARGLSLRATATDAAISPSLLSQVETGKVQPSVSTLYALVSRLGLSLDELLDNQPAAPTRLAKRARKPVEPVQRAADAPVIQMENGVTWRALAVMDPTEPLDALVATYAPGAASSLDESHMRHTGVEHGYLISGRLTLRLDFEHYLLEAGDSFCFDSRRPHVYVNHGSETAVGIWFVVGRESGQEATDGKVRTVVDALDAMSRGSGAESEHRD